jgi:hypothetical protein
MAQVTKEMIETAINDTAREGAPMDAAELASEFGISVAEVEQILGEEEPVHPADNYTAEDVKAIESQGEPEPEEFWDDKDVPRNYPDPAESPYNAY